MSATRIEGRIFSELARNETLRQSRNGQPCSASALWGFLCQTFVRTEGGGESRNPAHLQHIDRCRGEGVKKICERHIHTKCVNSWVSRFGKHFLWKFHRPVGRCFSCCEARQERKCNGNLHKNLLPNLETKLLTRSVWV